MTTKVSYLKLTNAINSSAKPDLKDRDKRLIRFCSVGERTAKKLILMIFGSWFRMLGVAVVLISDFLFNEKSDNSL